MSTETPVVGTVTATTPVVGTVTPPPTTTPSDWHTGFKDDVKSYATGKGWKNAESAVESYQQLEKHLGVPKEQILQLPADFGDQKAMDAVYDRLGRPKTAAEYGFKGADENFDKWAKDTFHKAGVTSNQAKSIMEALNAYDTTENTRLDETFKSDSLQKTSDLKTKWGNAYDQNVNVARAAATQFGLTPEIVGKLEAGMGFAKTMDLLHSIGSKLGEGKFIDSNGNLPGGILAPSQAQQKIESLIKDKAWSTKYMNGDIEARREMENLNKMVVGTYGQ